MNGWKTILVGDLVEAVKSWNPLRAEPDGVFDYIDLSALDSASKVVVGARLVLCNEAPSRARQLVSTGDVLVSTVRPNLNGVARVTADLDGATASTGFCVLRPRNDLLDGGYLFQWVKSPQFVSDMVRKATGASYPAVSDRIIFESRIPCPSLPEQRRIAAILDQADALRIKRRESLIQLDILMQSLFKEIFGNALSDKTRFELVELIESFRYGTSNKSGDTGYPALRIPNVTSGSLDLTELKMVQVDAAEFQRLKLLDGDLLFVRTNGNPDNVGRCAVFNPATVSRSGFDVSEFIYASYLIRTRLKTARLLPIVLQEYLSAGEGRQALRARCKTSAGQFNINTESLGTLPIPDFPMPLQEIFAHRKQTVERLKMIHRAALSELDALFLALQQRAFNGTL